MHRGLSFHNVQSQNWDGKGGAPASVSRDATPVRLTPTGVDPEPVTLHLEVDSPEELHQLCRFKIANRNLKSPILPAHQIQQLIAKLLPGSLFLPSLQRTATNQGAIDVSKKPRAPAGGGRLRLSAPFMEHYSTPVPNSGRLPGGFEWSGGTTKKIHGVVLMQVGACH